MGDHLPHVVHMRLLRDERPGRFMAAVEMDSQTAADAVVRELNGAPFNSLEQQRCRIVYVQNLVF